MGKYKIKVGDLKNYMSQITIKENEDEIIEISANIQIIKNKKTDKQIKEKISKKKEKMKIYDDKRYFSEEISYIKEALKKIANEIND